MFRTDAQPDHSGWDTAKHRESRKQPNGIGRGQRNCATQYAFDYTGLDSELDSLRHLGWPVPSRLHLG